MNRKRKIEHSDEIFLCEKYEKLHESQCSCSATHYKFEAVTSPIQHSEGPHWDPKTNTLYYVDTFHATAYRYNPANKDKKVEQYKIDGRNSIGIIVPIKDKKDEFIVTSDRYIYKLHWTAHNTGNLNQLHFVEEDKIENQFNDGKADSKGRLWTGTLSREPDLSVSPNGGHLYKIDLGEEISLEIENTSISNGVGWSKDNKRFFFIDSETKKVVVYDFDEENGELGAHKILFDLDKHPKLRGIPDGLAVDEKDNLWIALFGGHGIIHVDGNSGKLLNYVKLPATYCTSVCFGGPNQDILYVTTSNMKLKKDEMEKEPQAGAVFAIRDIGVKGPAPYECVLHSGNGNNGN